MVSYEIVKLNRVGLGVDVDIEVIDSEKTAENLGFVFHRHPDMPENLAIKLEKEGKLLSFVFDGQEGQILVRGVGAIVVPGELVVATLDTRDLDMVNGRKFSDLIGIRVLNRPGEED